MIYTALLSNFDATQKTALPDLVMPASKVHVWISYMLAKHKDTTLSLVTLEGEKVKFDRDSSATPRQSCKVLKVDEIVSWQPKVGAYTKSGLLIRDDPEYAIPYIDPASNRGHYPKEFLR